MSDIWHISLLENLLKAKERHKNEEPKMTIKEFEEKMEKIEEVFKRNDC